MKLLGETNCLVFGYFTEAEVNSYFKKFGERWWNDTENIICVHVQELTWEEKEEYVKFLGKDIFKCDFVIILF